MTDVMALTPAAPAPQFDIARAERAAKDFEAVVIAQLLAPMFESVETPSIAGGGKGQEYFNTLLQDHYAQAMAERGGFGIADQVKAALIEIQSQHRPSPAYQGGAQ